MRLCASCDDDAVLVVFFGAYLGAALGLTVLLLLAKAAVERGVSQSVKKQAARLFGACTPLVKLKLLTRLIIC